MKRTDLQAGQDYLLDSSHDWTRYGSGKRVTLVDAGFWSTRDGFATRHADPVQRALGDGKVHELSATIRKEKDGREGKQVLVLDHRQNRVEGVQASHLRATWEEGSKAVATAKAERVTATQRRSTKATEA